MLTRLKQLGKDSVIYGLGGAAAKGIGFLLLPIYTRIFTPSEYGTIEMLLVLNSLLGSVLVMGMDSAQSFYFFKRKKDGKRAQAHVITAIFQFRIIWGTGIVFLATLLSPIMNRFFFDDRLSWVYFAIAFSGALFAQLMSQSVEVFRLLYRPWRYIFITLLQTTTAAAITIVLTAGFQFGVQGFFVGILAGSIFAALFGWWHLRDYLDFSAWHKNWWPRVIKFGAPLVPAALAMYLLNTADRWFINYYHGTYALGLYAVGAKFAMLFGLVVITFRQAWWPISMDAMHSEDGPALYRTIGRLYLGCSSAGVLLLTAVSPHLVKWFAAPAFISAYPVVGILAWSSVFYGFYLITAGGIWKKKKTSWSPVLVGVAALLNIALDAVLVPKYGGIGAALATSVSFMIWNILTLIVSEHLWRVEHAFLVLGLQIFIGAGACLLVLSMYSQGNAFWAAAPITFGFAILLIAISVTRRHFLAVIEFIRDRMVRKGWEGQGS